MPQISRPARFPERIAPVLGPTAKNALREPSNGEKRRKLLVLLAAYADAGQDRPQPWQLIERLPFLAAMPRRGAARRLDQLLQALEREGKISRHGKHKGRYELHLRG